MQGVRSLEIWEFRCLGNFAISGCDGWREGPSRARGRALLEYLVSHARSAIPRSALVEALWPDCELEQCGHRLHLAVSGARLALRDKDHRLNPIVHRDDSYAWNPSIRIVADTDRFVACYNAATVDAMAEGVQIYAGPFLAGEPGDWAVPLRTRYEHMYVTMLERLALSAAERSDYAGGTEYALNAVAVDPAHEGAVRIAMLCLAKGGRRAAAVAEYENLERYLKRWLGVHPMPETKGMRDAIRSGTFS